MKVITLECPECHAELEYKRVEDSCDIYIVHKDGTIDFGPSEDHSGSFVYCSANKSHVIPPELGRKVIHIVANFVS